MYECYMGMSTYVCMSEMKDLNKKQIQQNLFLEVIWSDPFLFRFLSCCIFFLIFFPCFPLLHVFLPLKLDITAVLGVQKSTKEIINLFCLALDGDDFKNGCYFSWHSWCKHAKLLFLNINRADLTREKWRRSIYILVVISFSTQLRK